MILEERAGRIIKENFHALTHKNYRYFWMGQCVSLIGTWMQNVGQSWLVLSLTGSAWKLGVIGTLQFLPVMLFSLFAGLVVDKFPKKKILLMTQSVSMLLAFALAALAFTHTARFEYIAVLAFILGCCNTIDMPTRQSFNIEIVGKKDLMNAIALNSATFNLARILGPAVAGIMMAYIGAAWCFFLNGISFIAVIYGLLHIEAQPYVRAIKKDASIKREILDGLKYIRKTPILFETLCMVTIVGIFVFNYSVLVPVFTKNILHQQEKTYGFLLSALGMGSFLGAITVSVKSKSGPKKSIMMKSSIIIGITLILVGITRNYYFTAMILIINGIFNINFSTTANSTLQIHAKDEYRGRVMSVYTLVFSGVTPIGNLFSGYTAEKLGANGAFMATGGLTVICILLIVVCFKKIAISNDEEVNIT